MILNISVIGGSEVSSEICEVAMEVGRLLAKAGATVFCGGLSGVMECVSKGVREENGLVIGILPGTRPEDGNKYLSAALPTGMGYARNFLGFHSLNPFYQDRSNFIQPFIINGDLAGDYQQGTFLVSINPEWCLQTQHQDRHLGRVREEASRTDQ